VTELELDILPELLLLHPSQLNFGGGEENKEGAGTLVERYEKEGAP